MTAAERVQPALIIVMFSLTSFIQEKKGKKEKKEKKDYGKSWNIMDHHEIEN